MYDYIAISTLNDFIFCPYSIYLHNVYITCEEELFHAVPQTRGKAAHETIDLIKKHIAAVKMKSSVYLFFVTNWESLGKLIFISATKNCLSKENINSTQRNLSRSKLSIVRDNIFCGLF
jgi:CRISPR-associated protein Cas4